MTPSGSHGCLACGAPTESMLRIRVEDFKTKRRAMKGADRKVIGTISRSFCTDHADEAQVVAIEAVDAFALRTHRAGGES